MNKKEEFMKILFVEPPKDYWFIMGEYLPPPLGILALAAYLESKHNDLEVEVLDCQAEKVNWDGLKRRIESIRPEIIAPSGLATCNAYSVLRTVETAKNANSQIRTIVGGQHFTATAEPSLQAFPEIDFVVRGEGEETLSDLIKALSAGQSLSDVRGISFRHNGKIIHNPDRELIDNLDTLPFPGYHFVEKQMSKYHFKMMAGEDNGYALIEGSRGCQHRCLFCSQWKHWNGTWRVKSPRRIVDEIEDCYEKYGPKFFWLTDDNFGPRKRVEALCDEIIRRGLGKEIAWFVQTRCDDVVNYGNLLPKIRSAGCAWMLLGIERHDQGSLEYLRKGTNPSQARPAIDQLKKNDIFAQVMFIIGQRTDSHRSIKELREFASEIDPDLAIFSVLTPLPGTDLYEIASKNGWIEDKNWANYDMIHAIMPTEHLSRNDVQEELYDCYEAFYGSLRRRITGIFSSNAIKRRTFSYMAGQTALQGLRNLFSHVR